MNNIHVIIMAGGIGSRFWPMSLKTYPKQFHDVLGTGKSLIQQTAERFQSICPPERMYVVTNERYADLVGEQLPAIPKTNVLLEPLMRNTAPCIAYASYKIGKADPHAVMIVTPADHLVQNENEFVSDLKIAVNRAMNSDHLVTLGIKPHRPDTGYGYIHFDTAESATQKVSKVIEFTEKPPLKKAKAFVASGDYFWNSGIFVWSYQNIAKAFEKHLPEMAKLFQSGLKFYNTPTEQTFIDQNFPKAESISIDYGIMEKSTGVEMVKTDFGWSDLGTWGSLYEHVTHDADQNAKVGNGIYVFDAHHNMIRNELNHKLVIRGLDHFIVVQTHEATLICPKSDEQEIKQMVAELNRQS